MRAIPTAVTDLLGNRVQFRALFMDLDANTQIRIWTGVGQRTYNSQVYEGVGDFVQVGSVEEQSDLSAASVEVTLSGIPGEYAAVALTEPMIGRVARIHWVWFTDDTFATIAGGFEMYRGFVDTWQLEDNGETATARLVIENRLIEAQTATLRTWTAEDQRGLVNANDGFFDNVPDVQELDLGNWGSPG